MCGIVGIAGVENAAAHAKLALSGEQHRGQESAGIAVSDGEKILHYEGMGLIGDVFRDIRILNGLQGHIANGHVRYSTTGKSKIENIQPLIHPHPETNLPAELTISHNGNIPNARSEREKLEKQGVKFYTHTDTELILKQIQNGSGSLEHDLEEMVINAFSSVKGSFSAIITTKDTLIAIKDPWGNRPLCFGKLNNGYIVASESGALYALGAEYERELGPGEMLVFDKKGMRTYHAIEPNEQQQPCSFEHVYFARPDALFMGECNAEIQKRCGERLWEESPVEADYIVPILDSGAFGADGVSEASGLPYKPYIIKNRYIGRTFIMPEQAMRKSSVEIKFNPLVRLLKGKKIVLVEDSIVRGTTMKGVVHNLFNIGVKEVHLRINSPPYKFPCFYGIDTPAKDQLIASQKTVEQIREFIGATTLAYLSLEGLLVSCHNKSYCTACFDGEYKIPLNGINAT